MTQSTLPVVRINLSRPLVPPGWKILEDVPSQSGEVELEVVSLLEDDEEFIPGELIPPRARALGANLGLEDARRILNNAYLFPDEWREFHFIFPGTIMEDLDGARRIPAFFYQDYNFLRGPSPNPEWLLCFPYLRVWSLRYERVFRPKRT